VFLPFPEHLERQIIEAVLASSVEDKQARLNTGEACQLIDQGLSHPQYPGWLRNRIGDYRQALIIVDELVFGEQIAAENQLMLHPAVLSSNWFRQQLQVATEVAHAHFLSSSGLIMVKKSYAAGNYGIDNIADLIGGMVLYLCPAYRSVVDFDIANEDSYSTFGCAEALQYVNKQLGLNFQERNVRILRNRFRSFLIENSLVLTDLPFSRFMEEARSTLVNIHLQAHIIAAQKGTSFDDGLRIVRKRAIEASYPNEALLAAYGSKLGWKEVLPILVDSNLDAFMDYGNWKIGQVQNTQFIKAIIENQSDEDMFTGIK